MSHVVWHDRRPFRTSAALFGKAREVLLARLKGGLLGPGSALEVHAEPQDRNEQSGDTGDHILRYLPALLRAKLADPLVVGLNLAMIAVRLA